MLAVAWPNRRYKDKLHERHLQSRHHHKSDVIGDCEWHRIETKKPESQQTKTAPTTRKCVSKIRTTEYADKLLVVHAGNLFYLRDSGATCVRKQPLSCSWCLSAACLVNEVEVPPRYTRQPNNLSELQGADMFLRNRYIGTAYCMYTSMTFSGRSRGTPPACLCRQVGVHGKSGKWVINTVSVFILSVAALCPVLRAD